MQANKDQNWTDDAEFWDEAWADMDARLDAEPKRRKGILVWWPAYLGVAGVVALALVLTSGILAKEEVSASASSDNSPAIAANTARSEPTTGNVSTATADIAKNRPSNLKQVTAPTATIKEATAPSLNTRKREARVIPDPTSTSSSPVVAGPVIEDNPVVSPSGLSTSSDDAPKSVVAPVAPPNGREAAVVSAPLALREIAPLATGLKYPSIDLSVKRRPYRNPLTLDAAYTSSFNLKQPGYLLGLSYRIKNGSRFSFPLSLRYRLDQSEFKDVGLVQGDQTSVPTDGGAEGYLSPVSIGTDAIEVGAEVAWAAAPRLRLSTGLSVAYQLRALVNFEGFSPRGANDLAEEFNGQLFSVDYTRSQELFTSFSQNGTQPDFSRWALRGNVGVAYDILPRIGANFKATHLLRQPDRAKTIGLQTGRFEVGLSWRLR